MNILGLSAFYHDSAACLLRDGELVAAAEEERWSRIKHDPALPERAIRSCLEQGGIEGKDLDVVAFYEKPLLKLERILDTCQAVAPAGLRAFVGSMPSWFVKKLRVEEEVRELTGHSGPFLYCRHHEAHGASAFFPSPFDEAALLTVDGVGEWTTTSVGVGRDGAVRLLREIRFPHSLGLLYSAFTQHLGFRVNSGEYKVMGLAPYGTPRFAETILEELIDLREDGSLRLRMDRFAFLAGRSTVDDRFAQVLGFPPRAPEGTLEQVHMDLARSIQVVAEEVLLRQARFAAELTGCSKLCMAGGVALNSVANGRLLREGPFDDLWVQPAAADSGGALGAALLAWHQLSGESRPQRAMQDGMGGACFGPSYSAEEIREALEEHDLAQVSKHLDDDALRQRVASLLADEGQVVGWFQGPMELGPRALGNRSILADPRGDDVQERVNAKVKFREGFRPFAPAVLDEHASEWFDLDGPSPYMLLVVPVAETKRVPLSESDQEATGLDALRVRRSEIPAVTHVDGSARVQTVDADRAPAFHALLGAFKERSGCPVLLNTSFNLRGEPICRTPADACRTFLASGLDALAIGPYLVRRPEGALPTGEPPPPQPLPSPPKTLTQLRRFGLVGGLLLSLVAGLNLWQHHSLAAWIIGGAALLLLALGTVAPRVLAPLERVLGRVGRTISRALAALLLALVYLLVLTPTGWLRRLVRGDFLGARPDAARSTYWKTVTREPSEEDSRRMY